MNPTTNANLTNLHSEDRELQNKAFFAILAETDQPVDWAYEAWDGFVKDPRHKDNHVRAIAAQALCNLAKSDSENRMQKDFPALLVVTKDDRFVTARHTMQAIWKVGAVGKKQQKMLVDGLAGRFAECVNEKNYTLIRYDILQSLRNLYDVVKVEAIRKQALGVHKLLTSLTPAASVIARAIFPKQSPGQRWGLLRNACPEPVEGNAHNTCTCARCKCDDLREVVYLQVLELIETEEDLKYRKKRLRVWR